MLVDLDRLLGAEVLVKLVFEDLNEFIEVFRGKLSLEGLETDLDTFYPEGTVLDLNISLNDDLILVHGKALVARSISTGDSFLSVLRFLELDDSSVDLIQRMEDRAIESGVPPFDTEMAVKSAIDDMSADAPTQRIDAHAVKQEKENVYSAVTAALKVPSETGDEGPAKKTRRGFPRFLLLLAVALVAGLGTLAVVVFFFPGFLDESLSSENEAEVVVTPAMTAGKVENGEDPGPGPVTTSVPTKIPTRAPSPTPLRRASVVRSVDWAITDQATIVTVTGDGIFDEQSIRHVFLSDDPGPRILVRLIDVGISGVRLNTIVDGERLNRIRIWPHEEFDPPELYLVLDLARPGVRVENVIFEGRAIEIHLAIDREI